MHQKTPRYLGIFLGVLYGIALRLSIEIKALQAFGELVSISFLFLVPFVIGFIRIHFECKINPHLSYGRMALIAWQPIFVFLLVCFITLLEGSICIVMVLPAFMLCASIGGVVAGYINRRLAKRASTTLLSVALLPLLLAPLEMHFLHLTKTYDITSDIEINAPVDVVWQQLVSVSDIHKDEIPFSFTHLIGVPRPVKASMDGNDVGAVRTSLWELGVTFNEVITVWQPNKTMAYIFDIDPEKIPDDILDQHVKLGGKYFAPLAGRYDISVNSEGNTVLSLTTTLQDNTNFGMYSRVWGEIIFQDFHHSLLYLMKGRAENR